MIGLCTRRPHHPRAGFAVSSFLVLPVGWLLGACMYNSETTECTRGVRCPPELVCVENHGVCGPIDRVVACSDLPDDAVCQVAGLPGVCKQGICAPVPCERAAECADGNPCTDDACNQGRCEHTANDAPCDDGLFCNGADHCENKQCTSIGDTPCAAPTRCEERLRTCVGCMTDAHCPGPGFTSWGDCEAGSDICSLWGEHSREAIYWACNDAQVCGTQTVTETEACALPDPSGTACNDHNACTASDQCMAGQCQGQPLACTDANPCTREGCDLSVGCTRENEPRETLCPGGHCDGAGTCLACPNAGQSCSEGMAACETGTLRCSVSGNHVCEPSGVLPDGTPCGPGMQCMAGECR